MKEDLLQKGEKTGMNQLNRRSFLTLSASAAGAMLIPKAVMGENKSEQKYDGKKKPVRYPDPNIVALDKRFNKYLIGNTSIERVWTGALWAEGCAWNSGGRYLVWSDIPNDRLMRRRRSR